GGITDRARAWSIVCGEYAGGNSGGRDVHLQGAEGGPPADGIPRNSACPPGGRQRFGHCRIAAGSEASLNPVPFACDSVMVRRRMPSGVLPDSPSREAYSVIRVRYLTPESFPL